MCKQSNVKLKLKKEVNAIKNQLIKIKLQLMHACMGLFAYIESACCKSNHWQCLIYNRSFDRVAKTFIFVSIKKI